MVASDPFPLFVIPANAGTQSALLRYFALGPRVRGDDELGFAGKI